MLPKDQTFWEFCLHVWQIELPQKILLEASIESEFDVVGFLYLLWLHKLESSCAPEHFLASQRNYLEIINPVRRARRAAKNITSASLYQQLKMTELNLEKEYALALANLTRSTGPSETITKIYKDCKPLNFETSMVF